MAEANDASDVCQRRLWSDSGRDRDNNTITAGMRGTRQDTSSSG